MKKYSVVYNNNYFAIVTDELASKIIKVSFGAERRFLADCFKKDACITQYRLKGLRYQEVNERNFFKYFHTDFDDYFNSEFN